MSEIKVNQDSKLIKVIAAAARRERVDGAQLDEMNQIIKELAQDNSPAARHQLAQTVAYSVNELQKGSLDFLSAVADEKNIGYGDKAAFNVKTGHIKAYYQAKDSTTARSMVGSKQILVGTEEISARPAITNMDLKTGRVNMADLVREANEQMTNMKIKKVQSVLKAGVANYSSPFYATGTGIAAATLDAQVSHFRRLGAVTILGDMTAVGKLAPLVGMEMNSSTLQHSNEQINEFNNNGFIGRYKGSSVIAMSNAFDVGTITPIIDEDYLLLIPAGMTGDTRNLKIVNEGAVQAFDSQNIDDLVYEIRLSQWFGAAFCVGEYPTIGMYKIN